jgi:nuclear protein localization family protein 4
MHSLNELGAPDVLPTSRQRSSSSGGSEAHRRLELAKWLSDWHLVAFLGTCGLLSEVSWFARSGSMFLPLLTFEEPPPLFFFFLF